MNQLLGVALGTVGKLWQVSDISAAAGICTGHWVEFTDCFVWQL